MHLELGSLKPGQWRNLTSRELTIMQNAVRSSTKTASKVELRK
jgi:23S rRNA pseudouridine2604 synthase